jgi:hypothetical protein
MKKPKSRTRQRTSDAVETRLSPTDNLLALVLDKKVKPRRRVMEARRLLRMNLHVKQALQVLRDLVHEPPRKFRNSASFSMANRELLKYEHKRKGPAEFKSRMALPDSWRGLIGHVPSNVRWVPDEEWHWE